MAKQQLGVAPSNSLDTATVAFVSANKGSGGSGSGLGAPIYIQQTDPALNQSYVWYQVDGNGALVSVWVNYQPSATVTNYASESWTATDGAAWPSQWQIVTIGQAAATVQGNRGRMLSNGGGYNNGVNAYLPNMTSVADSETYVEVTFDGTVNEQYMRVSARVQANDSAGSVAATGYTLLLSESGGQAQLSANGGASQTAVVVSSGGFPVSTTWGVRLRLVGSQISWRVWNKNITEPTTWTQTVTDTTWAAAGRLQLSVQNGNDGAQRYFDLDNLTVTSIPA